MLKAYSRKQKQQVDPNYLKDYGPPAKRWLLLKRWKLEIIAQIRIILLGGYYPGFADIPKFADIYPQPL